MEYWDEASDEKMVKLNHELTERHLVIALYKDGVTLEPTSNVYVSSVSFELPCKCRSDCYSDVQMKISPFDAQDPQVARECLNGAYASYPSGHLWILTPMFPNWLITSSTTTRNQSVDGLFPLYVSLRKKVRPAITNSVGKTS